MADLEQRIADEVQLLMARFPSHEFRAEGYWVLLPSVSLVEGWNEKVINLAFQFPASGYPQNPFYGFYVPTGLRFNDELPTNFTDPAAAQPPFPGKTWAFFSGNPDPWAPNVDLLAGSNVLSWIVSINERLREGR